MLDALNHLAYQRLWHIYIFSATPFGKRVQETGIESEKSNFELSRHYGDIKVARRRLKRGLWEEE